MYSFPSSLSRERALLYALVNSVSSSSFPNPSPMIDPRLIRENPTLYKEGAKKKGVIPSMIDEFLELDQELRALKQDVEKMRAEQNAAAKDIAKLTGKDKEKAIAAMQGLKAKLKKQEESLKPLEEKVAALLLKLPAPPAEKVPFGKTDKDNVEIRTWGKIPKFDFEPKDHVALGRDLDILDIERGVKVSGSRFYFLKNEGALLELAVLKYTLDKLVKKGFTAFIPPVLVNYEAMMGTGYFPGGEEQAYVAGSLSTVGSLSSLGKMYSHNEPQEPHEPKNLFLVGTSEVPVTSYHSGEILNEADLPLKYAGISNCFRREAGTYGKDTHGIYRIHQFQKVEQVIIGKNDLEESAKMHQMILANAEEVLQDLKLPYRVVDVCSGDMGQGQYYKNDIETWMPSRKGYGETHSCSTFHEFQARRLNLRYRDKEGTVRFCHTLNNTCIASPRILIPLLEIYQQKDGSVVIPEVLRANMMGKERII